MKFEDKSRNHEYRRAQALRMGGEEKLRRLRENGVLNARERVKFLVDQGTFREKGLFATSFRPEMRERTPADGKVTGFARINGRMVGIISNDFTVLGASSSRVNSKKIRHVKETANHVGFPLVFLGESTGARMPDNMGSEGMGNNSSSTQYQRLRKSPWVSAVLGYAFGSSAWYACMSDFNVIRKGAVMAVSSAKLISSATGGDVDPEELGGWRLHTEVTGLADMVVDTDEEALMAVKQFLSYMPTNHSEAPPKVAVPPGSDQAVQHILDLLPDDRAKVYDVRTIIQAIVDTDSFFELKARFGKTIVTALSRIEGQSVGIIANNPLFKGGAIDADGCDKATSFLVLCDSFNIPIIFLVDQPGFLIGIEAEKKRMPGKVINWMNALSLCTVPKISIILRKTYGQGFLNMGGGGNADEVAAWWTGEISFMDPASATTVVYGVTPTSDPMRFAELQNEMLKEIDPYGSAATYNIQEVIDPRDTRDYLISTLQVYTNQLSCGIGQHLLWNWPTTF